MPHGLVSCVTLAALLAAFALLGSCLPTDVISDCQPELPPKANASGAMVTLQTHQWIWIENISQPDWGPRTEAARMVYESLRPGVVQSSYRQLLGIKQYPVDMKISYVTDGDTLCAAALTEYRNQSTGNTNSTRCNRICQSNFTSHGTRANLPLLVLDDWTQLVRTSEYLAIDFVDPDSRASYKCMGHFSFNRISQLPSLMQREKRCPEGDECLFNYDNMYGFVAGGCKSDFRSLNFCVSDLELCSYNINGDCPVCCRSDLCNRAVAEKVYRKWLASSTTRTTTPSGVSTTRESTTRRSASSHAISLWALAACSVTSLLLLLLR